MHPSRAALLAAVSLAVGSAPGCSLVSLEGLSGGVAPPDAATGGGDGEAGAPMGYAAQVLADAPLAYWRFGESSGTSAADASGNGNDATYEGGVALGATGALAGDADTAATFDGVSGFVTVGNRFGFEGQKPFSIEAWVSVEPRTTYAGLVSRNDAVGGPPSEGFLLFVAPSDGPFGFQRLDGASLSTATSVAGPTATGFTHVVGAFDGLELVVYVDGESQGAQTASFAIAGAVTDFVVGAEAGGAGNFLAGTLDEVAIYDHALPAARVSAHYLAGIGSP
ncbi:MAG TPA: LamG domain-containing protein [Polyangiaceae bacterium]|nr:LamG domain-containing protein [Polyangiaceae bacterium]